MLHTLKSRAACLLLVVVPLLGCNKPGPSKVDAQVRESAMPRTDLEGLQKLINLPYSPTAVKWEVSEQPGRNDWGLAVLLHLRPEDTQALLRDSGADRARKVRLSTEQLQWLPEDIRAANPISPGVDPKAVPVDAVRISVDPFVTPEKSPAIHGTAIVFEKQNVVYLGLYTM